MSLAVLCSQTLQLPDFCVSDNCWNSAGGSAVSAPWQPFVWDTPDGVPHSAAIARTMNEFLWCDRKGRDIINKDKEADGCSAGVKAEKMLMDKCILGDTRCFQVCVMTTRKCSKQASTHSSSFFYVFV